MRCSPLSPPRSLRDPRPRSLAAPAGAVSRRWCSPTWARTSSRSRIRASATTCARFPPAKGGMCGRFLAVNRGKRSLALDLKAPAGRDAFLRMVEKADVVVESFRPGVMDKLGVGYAALAAKNPKIVVCSISGFGQTGPYVDRAGHDLDYIALAGVLAMSGARRRRAADARRPDRRPRRRCAVGRDRDPRRARRPRAHRQGRAPRHLDDRGRARAARRRARQPRLRREAHARHRDAQRRPRLLRRLPHQGRSLPRGRRARAEVLDRAQHRDRPAAAMSPSSSATPERRRAPSSPAIFATKTGRRVDGRSSASTTAASSSCSSSTSSPTHPLHAARGVFFTIDGGEQRRTRSCRSRTPLGTPDASRRRRRASASTRARCSREYGFSDAEITGIVGG